MRVISQGAIKNACSTNLPSASSVASPAPSGRRGLIVDDLDFGLRLDLGDGGIDLKQFLLTLGFIFAVLFRELG